VTSSESWRFTPEVTREGDCYTAWSKRLPGMFGEGDTPEEAIESFWQFAELMRDEMAIPEWPHSREGWEDVFPELAGLDDARADDEWNPGGPDRDA
jgi:predicted RNase H-like HicB family nuclease